MIDCNYIRELVPLKGGPLFFNSDFKIDSESDEYGYVS